MGAHYFVTPNLALGVVGQMDWADQTSSIITNVTSTTSGTGWMIGPYLVGRIPGAFGANTLHYEARIAWGRSSKHISPLGTYVDKFSTSWVIASGKVSGSFRLDQLLVKPQLRISWYEETQHAYTDSLSNRVPSQKISLGELRFGPNFSRTFKTDNDTLITPSLGVSGLWNFGLTGTQSGAALGNNRLRARFDGGLTATNAQGWTLSLLGFYDGVGNDDYESYGGTATLTIPIR